MRQAWLRASVFVWILTVWGTGALYPGNALGQQSKTVEIPGDAYTAYEVPPGGAALPPEPWQVSHGWPLLTWTVPSMCCAGIAMTMPAPGCIVG